jgi:hypothetical protein
MGIPLTSVTITSEYTHASGKTFAVKFAYLNPMIP